MPVANVRASANADGADWFVSPLPAEASRRSQAAVVTEYGTATVIAALATSPELPIAYTVCAPFVVPAGIVTVMLEPPPAGTGVGDSVPDSTVPVLGSSSLKVTVCPPTNAAMVPLSVMGRLVTVVEELKVSDGEATVAAVLCALSAPVQLLSVGETVYFHVPPGTEVSVHVSAEIVPEHELPIVCTFPIVS